MTGGQAWLVLVIQIVIFETWSTIVPGKQTLSEWVWLMNSTHPWFTWLGLGIMVCVALHLFGPMGYFGRVR